MGLFRWSMVTISNNQIAICMLQLNKEIVPVLAIVPTVPNVIVIAHVPVPTVPNVIVINI